MGAFAFRIEESAGFSAKPVVAFRVNTQADGFVHLLQSLREKGGLSAFSRTIQSIDNNQQLLNTPNNYQK